MSWTKKTSMLSGQSLGLPREGQEPTHGGTTCLKRVLVFSPDADLARFLVLNLEDRYQIIREHRLDSFAQVIKEILPDLILIDLYTFPDDIIKELDIVHRVCAPVPVIALRAYMSLTPEITQAVEELTDVIFYKPVNVELITQAIEDLLK
jgi:DNA-binding NtrC family response regulator